MLTGQEIKERIKNVIETKGFTSNRSFAQAIDVPYTTFQSMLDHESQIPSIVIIARTLITYPELSAEWLLRGDGGMFRSESEYKEGYDELSTKYEELNKKYEWLLELHKSMCK